MPPIVATIDVHRPAADVFAYATDPSPFVEWQTGVVSGRMNSKSTPTIGDRCVTRRRIGFVERPVTSELVHYTPPERWGVRGIDGPIRATVEVAVESSAADRSRLTISVDFEGHGIGKILVPVVVERAARREMPANLARLKARVEAADPRSTSRRRAHEDP